MLTTVARRVTMPHTGRNHVAGKRKYIGMTLPDGELARVHEATLHALGLEPFKTGQEGQT